jgi:hypothetical protein
MEKFPFEFACLYDQKHDFTFYAVPAVRSENGLPEKIRNMFIARMERFGYVGFSYEIDNEFHYRSTYVLVGDADGNIVMTSRVTLRPEGTMVPFEYGLRTNGESYKLEAGTQIVDINTYAYSKGHYETAMPLLTAGLGLHVKAKGARGAFCLYDQRNQAIRDSYSSVGFVHSKRFPEPIYFPTFCYRRRPNRDIEQVFWRIMEWDEATIDAHAVRALKDYQHTEGR